MNPEGTMIDLRRGIKAAMFDCFNTLVFPEDWPFLEALAKLLGTQPDIVNDELKKLKHVSEIGQIVSAERIRRVVTALGGRISNRVAMELADLELAIMVEQSVVYPGAQEALKLIGANLRTVLVSNAHPNNRRMVLEKGLVDDVIRGIFSCDPDVGVRKPDEGIYRAALKELKVDPHQCVYFGDGGDHELEPPRALGMTVVWVRSPNQCAIGTPDCDYVVNGVHELQELCVF